MIKLPQMVLGMYVLHCGYILYYIIFLYFPAGTMFERLV